MKKIASFLMLFSIVFTFSQVKWMSMEQALQAQKIQPKKILIDFYGNSSDSSKKLDNSTFSHPLIAEQINKYYYSVKFDAESKEQFSFFGKNFGHRGNAANKNTFHEFPKYMNVSTLPSIVFLDEQNQTITILNGFLSPKELEPYISMISGNEYKKIKTRQQWDEYQEKFKSKIKD